MRRDGVLVREDGVFALGRGDGRGVREGLCVWVDDAGFGVDGGHDREVVLVFLKVLGGGGDCLVHGVQERGVVWAEREFVDEVGEVERWLIGLSVLVNQ